MFLLYLDDSGSVSDKAQNFFVLGGFCISEHSVQWLSRQMDELAKQIWPENPKGVEFHAAEMFSGRKMPWTRFSKPDRINLIRSALNILKKANSETVLFACAIHKESFPAHDPYEKSFEDLCSRFSIYLSHFFHDKDKETQRGIIILDESSYEQKLQKHTLRFMAHGTQWGQLKDIIEVPMFVDSKASRGIQMADLVAYSVFRYYNADDMSYFRCIENRFHKDKGVFHGLAHKELKRNDCTCPACLSRNFNFHPPQ
ncbi:MAG: DUF3800 domain-containing protein [Desulfatibacillaceae bacterium]|nr:DUF3800 domain-containing protein [Desulfatibacillaceae bacterium]